MRGRPKKEGGAVIKSFTLTKEEAWLLDKAAEGQGMNKSDFVGWLVKNFMVSSDPIRELDQIKLERKEASSRLLELEKKEEEVLERIKLHKENVKNNEKLKEKAIDILTRKFREGEDYLEIENMARFWALRLACDIKELIYKAGINHKLNQEVKNGNEKQIRSNFRP